MADIKAVDFYGDAKKVFAKSEYEKGYEKGREDAINEISNKFEEIIKLDTRESYYWTVIWRLFQKMIDEIGKDINVTTKKGR